MWHHMTCKKRVAPRTRMECTRARWRCQNAFVLQFVFYCDLPERNVFKVHTLLCYSHQHMQEKTSRLRNDAQQTGLKISQKKAELMFLDITNPTLIRVNGEDLPTTEKFTYLDNIVRHDGGAGNEIRNAFRMLINEDLNNTASRLN